MNSSLGNGFVVFYIAVGIAVISLILISLPTLIAREKRRLEKKDKKKK